MHRGTQLGVLALLVLGSCGGTSDYASPYVGTWSGAVTASSLGQASNATAVVPIREVSTNVIELLGFCADSDLASPGPMGSVSANGFTLSPSSCTWTSAACTAGNFTLSVSGGDGNLSGGTLNFAFNGSGTCGSETTPLSIGFSSSSRSGNDSPPNGEGLSSVVHISS